MTTAAIATRPASYRRAVIAAQVVVALFLVLRVAFFVMAQPNGDETYYWIWGQYPALSYYDHPPLLAWLQGALSILGWSSWSLRAGTWVTLSGVLALFWLWARRLAPEAPELPFWRMSAIFMASPLFQIMTWVAIQDHLLILLCLAAGTFFLHFAEKWETQGRLDRRALYAAAALLGLAVLTKYNAIFLGLGFALFVLVRPRLRQLLRNPHLYLAALLSIALQAPVFIWNAFQGFASYRYHLLERFNEGRPFEIAWYSPRDAVLVNLLILSPFIWIAIARLAFVRPASDFEGRARALGFSAVMVSTIAILILSLFIYPHFNWNIVAYILLLPLLFRGMDRAWLFWPHVALGLLFGAAMVYHFSVAPLATLVGRNEPSTASYYGWPEVAAELGRLDGAQPADFVATPWYGDAAKLAFALGDRSVTSLDPARDQYDYWFDVQAHIGQSAWLVVDDDHPVEPVRGQFETITLVRDIPIRSFGRLVRTAHIYRAERYLGAPR